VKKHEVPAWAQSMRCVRGSCETTGWATGEAAKHVARFKQAAMALSPVPDKVTTHTYEVMYGVLLLPTMRSSNAPKLFEIGLGCPMHYGPGASVALWKVLFPTATIWEAEYDSACVVRSRAKGMLEGINTVTGDQGDKATVQRWAQQSGGQFDAIIDDGGHKNNQIRTSFETLWSAVKPGGVYFLEDLQVGRFPRYRDLGDVVMSDMIQEWVGQLLSQKVSGPHPLPKDVESIFCQREACAVVKSA